MSVTHKFVVDHPYDGDTVAGAVVLTFDVQLAKRVRLITVNCPELSVGGQPNQPGVDAAAFTAKLCPAGAKLTVSAPRDMLDQYGRILADIILPDGSSLSQQLLDSGNAAPMQGKTLAKLLTGSPSLDDGEDHTEAAKALLADAKA